MSQEQNADLAWLSLKTWAGEGSLAFGMTENGDVGLYWANDDTPALGVGDKASEALHEAHQAYHRRPGCETCNCIILEADGDALA